METDRGAQNVSFPSADTTAYGCLEVPASGRGPGVVVIQEWWGLTTHITEIVGRLAGEGFVALAPDLYGGVTTHDSAEAARMKEQLPEEQAARDLGGAIDYLLGHECVTSATVGVIGFCMGGGFVLRLAAQQGDRVSAALPFYGLPGEGFDPSSVRAAVQGHYGEHDPGVPIAEVRQLFADLSEAGVSAELQVYDAGHAFLNDERPDRYVAAAAELAWSRAVAFLHEHV